MVDRELAYHGQLLVLSAIAITEVTAQPFNTKQRKAAPSGGLVLVATWRVGADGYFMLLSLDSSAMVTLSS